MRQKTVYVELSGEDRALLDALVADASAAARRPVRISEVVRSLIRAASKRRGAVRVGEGTP